MYYMGIDIGSTSSCAVIINDKGALKASALYPTGAHNKRAIEIVSKDALAEAGIDASEITAMVSTGYGREMVDGRAKSKTEIACHAKGIQHYFPGTNLLIDIGGQDSKAITMNASGKVVDFAMNDKCAAGTGRFLEAMSRVLEISLQEYVDLDIGAVGDQQISSMCTVFAESEVVSMVAKGINVGEIASGINRAIASRTLAMAKRMVSDLSTCSIAMSGGVAKNGGVVRALSQAVGNTISIPPEPEIIGALGAAHFAREL